MTNLIGTTGMLRFDRGDEDSFYRVIESGAVTIIGIEDDGRLRWRHTSLRGQYSADHPTGNGPLEGWCLPHEFTPFDVVVNEHGSCLETFTAAEYHDGRLSANVRVAQVLPGKWAVGHAVSGPTAGIRHPVSANGAMHPTRESAIISGLERIRKHADALMADPNISALVRNQYRVLREWTEDRISEIQSRQLDLFEEAI
jgi:hypothetical protein